MEEGKKVGGYREQDSICGIEVEANKETNSGECTNTKDIDINLEPGPGRADKNVYSINATTIPKTNSETMKVVQDK